MGELAQKEAQVHAALNDSATTVRNFYEERKWLLDARACSRWLPLLDAAPAFHPLQVLFHPILQAQGQALLLIRGVLDTRLGRLRG